MDGKRRFVMGSRLGEGALIVQQVGQIAEHDAFGAAIAHLAVNLQRRAVVLSGLVHSSLMPVQDAIVRRNCLAIHYDTASRGTITGRVVEPLGLVYYSRRWHLIAWCRLRRDFRDFRLDRMSSWEVLDERYEGHAEFSVKEFLRECIENRELTPATVLVDAEALERFRAELPSTPVSQQTQSDGRVKLELLSFSIPWLSEWLLGFGLKVEALEPQELRDAIREAAEAVASRYAEDFAMA